MQICGWENGNRKIFKITVIFAVYSDSGEYQDVFVGCQGYHRIVNNFCKGDKHAEKYMMHTLLSMQIQLCYVTKSCSTCDKIVIARFQVVP